uniref:ATP-dependent DNA helicase Q4 n=1 Tax=Electrophorus electricus TaxID=8005 RepID=A0AAY5EAX1_ELEEL
MDRYNDVKLLLKKWERSFTLLNNRKPNKDDIDAAPEETKNLYKEYRKLKEAKENTSKESKTPVISAVIQSSGTVSSDCWGSHLNRKNMPATVAKLTAKDKETLQASAQYFGMKLKSNLGASVFKRGPPEAPYHTKHVANTPGESSARASSQCPTDTVQVGVERCPVEGSRELDTDHISGEVEIRTGSIAEGLDGPEEASPASETRKRSKRSRKVQDSGQKIQTEAGHNEQRNARKKGHKRQREPEGEEPAEGNGHVPKRRRTKRAPATGECPPKGRKKKGRGPEEGEDELEKSLSTEKTVTRKPKMPQENLLGEVEEGDVRAASARMKNTARNGNFVRINLKKKSHVKGFALRGAALRKQMYMQKFQLKGERFGGASRGRGRFASFSRQGDSCYKCGGIGHWAQDCRGRGETQRTQQDAPPEDEEPFELPTLEEVARATGTLRSEPIEDGRVQGEPLYVTVVTFPADVKGNTKIKAFRLGWCHLLPGNFTPSIAEIPSEVYHALRDFGYKSFRPGQEKAIMRILSGLSTLVVLSTGLGKSLCYQLPAYLYALRSKCITLVVSPLVSLMDDQLSGLPPKLKAACIHSNMSQKQREAAIEKVKAGQVHVLLLSPEALVGGGHAGSGCLPPTDQLPPVAFACIDEAHCVSEWSHNFRPCYLRLCKVLRERLGVRCLLGLTATATLSTALDIAHHLDIRDQEGIAVRSAAVPHNLHLSVSMDTDKDQALVSLLKGERFGALDSIIVYCTRREETNRVAALLRTCLQGVMLRESSRPVKEQDEENNPVGKKKKALARKKIRKPLKWMSEAYHAGLSASERRRVQNNFMCGELRVVVATVAFGMGLDKPDVRAVVHYNMPKSFESYVQEIGRAGRDGEPAHCHLFLDPEGGDLHELRRHIYADTVDHYTIKRLVQRVFPPCKCRQIQQRQKHLAQVSREQEGEGDERGGREGGGRSVGDTGQSVRVEPAQRVCHTHERAIPMEETVEALDVTEEGLETLLCYLELHPQRWVELLHPTLSMCRIMCYGGPQQVRKLAKVCPPVAVVLARRRLAGHKVEACDFLEFDVVELADTMGWQLPLVKRGLRQLRWVTEPGSYGGTGRSGVHVEFSALSFYLRSYGDLTSEELDGVCAFLHGRVQAQERTQLRQLQACFRAFRSVAYQSCGSCMDELDEVRSLKLKGLLADYFEKRKELDAGWRDEDEALGILKLQEWEEQIQADVRAFLACHGDEKFSGRAVARIFHGIGSPCYPAQTYGRDRRYWRKYLRFDFNDLIRIATQEIIRTR